MTPSAHAWTDPHLAEVEPHRRADVVADIIDAADRRWRREHRRPPTISHRDALLALQFEALLVCTAAASVRSGVVLTDDDMDRLAVANDRIERIVGEVAR